MRLYFYSDSSFIWRRGSLLRKNKHVALMTQTRESEVLVRAQGARPENMLFLIHEVFETLIKESFHGVKFDYQVPCPECSEEVHVDPYTCTCTCLSFYIIELLTTVVD